MLRIRLWMQSLKWVLQVRFQRFTSRVVNGLPPSTSNLLLHQLERGGAPEELDLAVPSWRVTEIVNANHLIEESREIVVPRTFEGMQGERLIYPELRVRELNGVSLDVDSGLVFARDRVIGQPGTWNRSSRDAAFISGGYTRYRRSKEATGELITSQIAPFGDAMHHYHFLLETLPRALHIQALYPDVEFLTAATSSPAAQEIIDALGIRVRLLPESRVFKGSKVIVSDQSVRFWPRLADVNVVREAVVSEGMWHKTATEYEPREPVYISRARSTRALENEESLSLALESVGVRTLYLEDLSFADQVATIRQASVLIGAHGAGLANALWMEPGTQLIEISSGDRFEACYRRLACVLGMRYDYVQVPGSEAEPFGKVTTAVIEQVKSLIVR